MGEVWLADEVGPRNFKRQVALKRLLATEGISDYARESFVAEAQVIARLDHPNIVRLIELGESDDRGLYLVLDYIDGAALDRVIRKGGALSVGAVTLIGREVARALDAVHTMQDGYGGNLNVVHRDVSPANILIGRDGRVRLSDFGVARIHGLGGEKTETGVFKGKLPYMPPEQALGEPFDGRADVFSLGITIFEALIGGRLRRAETQGQLIAMIATERVPRVDEVLAEAHPGLAQAIDMATAFRAAERIGSAGQLALVLQQVMHSLGPGAEEVATAELCDRVAFVAGGPTQAGVKQPWSMALSGESSAFTGPAPLARSGTNLSVSQSSYVSQATSGSFHSATSGAPAPGSSATFSASGVFNGDATIAQPPSPASVPPPGHASVTRVASITDMSARTASEASGGAKTWLYAIGAAALLGGGIGAAWVFFGPHADATRGLANTGSGATEPSAETPNRTLSSAAPTTSGEPTASAEPVASAPASGAPTSKTHVPPVRTSTPPATASTAEESGPGTLTVTANPWGNVSVDGRSYGSTPLPGISLSPGTHTVVVSNPELGSTRSATVKIKSGQAQGVRFDFKKTD